MGKLSTGPRASRGMHRKRLGQLLEIHCRSCGECHDDRVDKAVSKRSVSLSFPACSRIMHGPHWRKLLASLEHLIKPDMCTILSTAPAPKASAAPHAASHEKTGRVRPVPENALVVPLFQRGADRGKDRADPGSNSIHRGNDSNRYPNCDKTVFDGRGAGLISEKCREHRLHGGSCLV